MKKFGVSDYISMWKKYGIKLPLFYFWENQLFDLINKTDTHKRVLKSDYQDSPTSFSDGVMYMVSFKSVVIKTTKYIFNKEYDNFKNYNLIDIGSGKGKVLIIWCKFLSKYKLKNNIFGFEYSKELYEISKKNLSITQNQNKVSLHCIDISEGNEVFEKQNIFYLFNPFNENVLNSFLSKINKNSYIVYNNPQHKDFFELKGFTKLAENKGFHPNLDWIIYKN